MSWDFFIEICDRKVMDGYFIKKVELPRSKPLNYSFPLAVHAAQDQRCTTEDENEYKPTILLLRLFEEVRSTMVPLEPIR
jgi:hypothetical protein